MDVTMKDLVGRWRKLDEDEATAAFPREIEFFADRTYKGTLHGDRRPEWDEAAFDVLDNGHVRIETANDRKVTYATRLERDQLSFEAGNRRVTYRRVK